ncbi:MAG TPA: zinc-ribbon domain-containing protein [Bacteroidales bacterium]|nr:zinc-ribbon domain-containing protein [Bacteroidales bacterium]HOR82450.1 zinc-ribbon domain-containing protein [Bacteroidales bacterium]HPJ91722.1 zinc-ribbon domain-containing protein [Bacteroidales bacterium]
MVYCRHCGYKNEQTQHFCVNCGEPIIKAEEAGKSSIEKKEKLHNSIDNNKQPSKKNLYWGLFIGFIALIIVIAFFARDCTSQQNTEDISLNNNSSIEVLSFDFLPLYISNELIPVVCKYYNDIGQSIIDIEVYNASSSVQRFDIKVEIPDLSNISENTFELQPYATEILEIPLTFKCKFFQINEKLNTQINFSISQDGRYIYRESVPINIASKGTMIWSYQTLFDMKELIACFVNPHDPNIERIVSEAKELKYDRRLTGYQINDPYMQAFETKEQIKAIFLALRNIGTSYVNSTLTFTSGHTQRVRTPSESIENKQANCIDGAVLFASLFENIGLEPLIIIGPQHAFVAVRKTPGSKECYFLETTVTGETNNEETIWDWFSYLDTDDETIWELFSHSDPDEDIFEKALNDGSQTFSKWYNENTFELVDIKECRNKNILPAFSCD